MLAVAGMMGKVSWVQPKPSSEWLELSLFRPCIGLGRGIFKGLKKVGHIDMSKHIQKYQAQK